ncbi:MAG: hypothetical protein KR126chlam3_00411 [Chlamydiae bacterium]|nr:hypothetical protein [Chlamydiota bacterium]
MYKKLALIATLVIAHLLCAESKQDCSSHFQFKREEMPFGIQRQNMILINENTQPKTIGSVAIISSEQFCIFDSPIFANIDKNTLPPEVAELYSLTSIIKKELTTSLEQVVILGDLYIDPKFRGQGYAQLLIQNICKEIFTTTQTNFIIVAPNPFEYENNLQIPLRGTPNYEEKKERLVKLYQRNGFVPCKNDVSFMYLEKK